MKKVSPLFRLPQNSSFRGILFLGFLKKFFIFFTSLTLIFLSTGAASQVIAQTTDTFIRIGDGTTLIVRIVGGQQTSIPVYLGNFNDPDGLAAFSFKFKYDPTLLPIADANGDGKADAGQVTVGSFLGSSGKQVACSDGYIDKDTTDNTKRLLNFSCITPGPTPSGPTGSGDLATINFTTGNTIGVGPLSLSATELVDNTEFANLIPHNNTANNLPFRIAKCADFTGDKFVAIFDLLALAPKFGLNSSSPDWDPKYDIDDNNFVNVFDILIAAREFTQRCP